ncbi:MAG TPA: hypothetical protein VFS43_44595 [Polyangiaceae bacterium]|nr:hypothetical protein [Polyangiaceae bacterium]
MSPYAGGWEPVAALIISLLSSIVVGGSFLLADRHYLRRHRDPYGRRRMWNDATLGFALCGLFIPTPLAYGAHVWVTRRGPWWRRALFGVAAAALATFLWNFLALAGFALLGIEFEG